MATIECANVEISLVIPGISKVPFPIEGFAQDDVIEIPEVKPVEVLIGVDRRKSSGYVAYLVPIKIKLQADSPSIQYFDIWRQNMDLAGTDLPGNMTIVAPGLLKLFDLQNGSLTSAQPIPSGKKLFQPQMFEISFESVSASPIPTF